MTNAGIHLVSNISKQKIKFAGFGFLDDADLLLVDMNNSMSVGTTIQNLQVLLHEWESGQWISGGALSAVKSHWTELISIGCKTNGIIMTQANY